MYEYFIPAAYVFSGICLVMLGIAIGVAAIIRKRKDAFCVIECLIHAITALVIGGAYFIVVFAPP